MKFLLTFFFLPLYALAVEQVPYQKFLSEIDRSEELQVVLMYDFTKGGHEKLEALLDKTNSLKGGAKYQFKKIDVSMENLSPAVGQAVPFVAISYKREVIFASKEPGDGPLTLLLILEVIQKKVDETFKKRI